MPTVMQCQEVGQQKLVMPAYMEAYVHGNLSRDYKNGKADCDMFGMGEGRQLVIFQVVGYFLGAPG